MVRIQTILCPVDFSAATERQVRVAADLCRLLGSRLIVHHNLGAVGTGAAVGWMWSVTHAAPPSNAEAFDRLKQLLADAAPGVPSEARLTHGPPSSCVLRVARMVAADLLLLTAHSGTHDDHMSISEQVLERSGCAVLALHEPGIDQQEPQFSPLARFTSAETRQRVLVPTSFSAVSNQAIRFAAELARVLPVELHLLHVEFPWTNGPSPEENDRSRMLDRLPPEIQVGAKIHVVSGDPAHQIALVAEQIGASLIVMGEHARTGIGRWFRRDTGRLILHHAGCPIWYVPSREWVATHAVSERSGRMSA